MTHLIDDLIASLPEEPVPVRSVQVGAHVIAVSSRICGLATFVADDSPHVHCPVVRNAGRLHEKTAQELAEYARSRNPVEAGIGVAAINSLLDLDEKNAVALNASDLLAKRGAGKNVALIGHFPFVPTVRKSAANLWVLEIRPAEGDYPAESARELIPQADIVAITGNTLVNHTLDGLLDLCRPDALVIIIGPSTPLSDVMFDHGVSILAGSKIIDEKIALLSISQGASFHQTGGIRLLSFTRDGSAPV